MSILSDNIRHLRAQKQCSQQKIADELIISRGAFAKYEEGKSEPPLETLKRISHYFHISIDIMISVNLKKIPMQDLLKMGDNRILLPITVDKTGKDNIEILPHKAKAGYMAGYSDPEFIESLDHISLPFLNKGKYRAFPIEGDSMPPHKEGSFIVGRYVEKFTDIKEGKSYVILTRNEGIVYKRIHRKNRNMFMLHSDNSFYQPYEIKVQEIIEIWEYSCSLATKEFEPDDLSAISVKEMLKQIRADITEIKRT